MPLLSSTRSAQRVMSAEFVFSFNDTKRDVNGVLKTFGSTFADNIATEVIKLPLGTLILGGSMIVETAGVGPAAYTMAIGHGTNGVVANPASLLAATTLLAAGRTPLTGLGLVANDGADVYITIASTVANATAGRFRLNVTYIIDGKADDVISN